MKEIAPGLIVETVADILGEAGEATTPLTSLVSPPRLEGQPPFPEPGLYFGMPEDVYHSIHACSASGLKKLSASSMDYWASSPLNPEREDDDDTVFKAMGRAYHCRICEGEQAFHSRYYIELDKADFTDDLCVTIDDIRKAIEAIGGTPKGTKKDALADQLLDLCPQAEIWDREVKAWAERHEGMTPIPAKTYRRIEIAARMIENDPQLGDAFRDGHAEVSIFWRDKLTGAPMKARLDYLKMAHIIDLKSFSNAKGRPVQRAIDMAISNQKYFIAVAVYLDAVEAAKSMVKNTGGKCVYTWQLPGSTVDASKEQREWAWKWAHQPEPEVLFIFQQTGIAPVTRGRIMPKASTYEINRFAVQFLTRKWVKCATTYGTDPWLDVEPVTRTEDEAMTWAATDFGEVN